MACLRPACTCCSSYMSALLWLHTSAENHQPNRVQPQPRLLLQCCQEQAVLQVRPHTNLKQHKLSRAACRQAPLTLGIVFHTYDLHTFHQMQ